MTFNDPNEVDSIAWQIRQADYPRGLNRARIDQLLNGWPPFSQEEVEENNTAVNVNFLEGTRLAHDARSQFNNAFLKPGSFFSMRTDYGPKHKKAKYGSVVTRHINRRLKKSADYYECFRSKFALNVAHGIGPSVWPDQDCWCPEPMAIADIGIPARTLLTMKNLPFFYIIRSFTAPELIRLTRGSKVDKGWNMDLVQAAIEWIDHESMMLYGSNFQEVWSPEKAEQRIKGDGGWYAGDAVPTIDTYDFYFWDDSGKHSGWRRRMILDSWSTPSPSGNGFSMNRRTGDLYDDFRGKFLYTSGDRVFADGRENIVAFQFADLSAVAPFQYHGVRSLGFLLYAICHLQNRLRGAFTEAVFENLLQMFRIKSMEDVQRALKLKIHGFSFIDDTLSPIPAAERFQPNMNLVQLGLAENANLISQNSSSYTQQANYSQDKVEKTKFQVMAETNAMTSLVSAGLNQAYHYQNFEFYEIVRRFMRENSRDPDVRSFRADCLKDGVPPKVLVPECWEVEPERVMGAGNKTLEMTIAQQLMEWRPLFNPEAQTEILRDATLAITDDPGRAERLVPEEPHVSDSVHDTELAFGSLMQGIPVTPKPGLNSMEVAATMVGLMERKIDLILRTNPTGTIQDIAGLGLSEMYAKAFIAMLAKDESSKEVVKELSDRLSNSSAEIQGMIQRQQEAAQAGNGQGQSQMDPEVSAKMQATMMTAQQKVQQMRESHAAKTAQRKIQFQQSMQQDQQRHELELQREAAKTAAEIELSRAQHGVELAAEDVKTAAEIEREKAKAEAQTKTKE